MYVCVCGGGGGTLLEEGYSEGTVFIIILKFLSFFKFFKLRCRFGSYRIFDVLIW